MALGSDSPYPTMEEIKEDCAALRVISPAYAGREGELTAILQYVYQAIVFGERGMREEGKLLSEIAAAEMRHLEILGTLIAKLGAPPVFTNCPPYPVGYFSASCVNYVRSPRQMIQADVCAERNAVACYERMLDCLSNVGVAEVIARILEDERVHLAAFEELLSRLSS